MVQDIPDSPVIEIKDLRFRYHDTDIPALAGINLTVRRGEFIVIRGAPGAGKTTLCRCLNGIIPHAVKGSIAGTVLIQGKDNGRTPVQEICRQVGLVMEDPDVQIVGRTVFEDIAFGMRNLQKSPDEINARIPGLLSQVGLAGFRDRLSHTLSGGEKQRLALAGILAMEPAVLVLDEAFSEMDSHGRRLIYQELNRLRQTRSLAIITVGQDREDLPGSPDRIINLCRGRIVPGSPAHGPLPGRAGPGKRKNIPLAHLKPLHVEIKDLNYHNNGLHILKNINLKMYHGEFAGLTGRNGAGKTSLLRHICAVIKPPPGTIFINRTDLTEIPADQVFREGGYVFQNPDQQIFNHTVAEELEFGLKNLGMAKQIRREKSDRMLRTLGLHPYHAAHPFSLSRGYRQIIACAAVAVMEPPLLLIDEPNSGLDHGSLASIIKMLRELNERGTTILLVTHDAGILDNIVERIIEIDRGTIVADSLPLFIGRHGDAP